MTYCPICKLMRADKSIKRRRMMCKYVDDSKNYLISCLRCFTISEEDWQERFDDYYANCM